MDIKKYMDCEHIELALTHSSYANENKLGMQYNERIEFLGDAVLGVIVAEYLFKEYPDLPEGCLTKIRASVVCEDMLAKKARQYGINDLIRLGKGEEHTGGRQRNSLISDAVESVIAAVYLDRGMDEARAFVLEMLKPEIEEIYKDINRPVMLVDSKTALQEIVQRDSTVPVEYEIIGEEGPAHDKSFKARVSHNGKVLGEGVGKSKKKAEQNAAKKAIEMLEKQHIIKL